MRRKRARPATPSPSNLYISGTDEAKLKIMVEVIHAIGGMLLLGSVFAPRARVPSGTQDSAMPLLFDLEKKEETPR